MKTSWKPLTGSAKSESRILTRAGVSGDSFRKRFAHYHRILEQAKGKIEILPGGGLTWITVKPLSNSWA